MFVSSQPKSPSNVHKTHLFITFLGVVISIIGMALTLQSLLTTPRQRIELPIVIMWLGLSILNSGYIKASVYYAVYPLYREEIYPLYLIHYFLVGINPVLIALSVTISVLSGVELNIIIIPLIATHTFALVIKPVLDFPSHIKISPD